MEPEPACDQAGTTPASNYQCASPNTPLVCAKLITACHMYEDHPGVCDLPDGRRVPLVMVGLRPLLPVVASAQSPTVYQRSRHAIECSDRVTGQLKTGPLVVKPGIYGQSVPILVCG